MEVTAIYGIMVAAVAVVGLIGSLFFFREAPVPVRKNKRSRSIY